MKKILLALACAAFMSFSASAQVQYTTGTYTQNFDSLASTGLDITFTDNSTILGWTAYSGDTGYSGSGAFTFSLGTETASADAYDAGTGSSTAGELYSFGVAGTNAVTERAFGSLGSGATGEHFFVLEVENTNDFALVDFTITYDGEQWRRGANATQRPETMHLFYRIGGTSFDNTGTWTELITASFTSPNATLTTASALDGNAAANRISDITALVVANVASGQSVWFAWIDPDHSGTDHGMSIDNVRFSATPIPEPGTFAAALMLVFGLLWSKRRKFTTAWKMCAPQKD